MARDLLFEIGVEEIPASYVLPALAQLAESLERELTGARLSFESTRTLATPRRMTVIVNGVADAQTSETRTVTGPPARVAFSDDGAPTKAATGFARSQGVDVAALTVVGDYVQVEVTDDGGPAVDVLPRLLAAAVDTLTFPKTMKWGPERRFASHELHLANPARAYVHASRTTRSCLHLPGSRREADHPIRG